MNGTLLWAVSDFDTRFITVPIFSLVGALAGIVFTALLREPVNSRLARLFGGLVPRSDRSIRGFWQLEYEYPENGLTKNEVQLVSIRVVGTSVFGQTFRTTSHCYTITGFFRQAMYFTGYWNSTKQGHSHHGAFQLILNPDGVELNGRWLGFSEKSEYVNYGNWKWKRLSHTLSKSDQIAALEVYNKLIAQEGFPKPAP